MSITNTVASFYVCMSVRLSDWRNNIIDVSLVDVSLAGSLVETTL